MAFPGARAEQLRTKNAHKHTAEKPCPIVGRYYRGPDGQKTDCIFIFSPHTVLGGVFKDELSNFGYSAFTDRLDNLASCRVD